MVTNIKQLGGLAISLVFLAGATLACNVEGATNTRLGAITGDARRNESGYHLRVGFNPSTSKGGNPRVYNTYVGINTEKGYPRPYGFFSAADENGL